MRVLKRQTLTVGGRTTYMSRGGAGKPHVHLAASDLRPAPALLPFGARNGNGCSAPSCTFPICARPTVLPEWAPAASSWPPSNRANQLFDWT